MLHLTREREERIGMTLDELGKTKGGEAGSTVCRGRAEPLVTASGHGMAEGGGWDVVHQLPVGCQGAALKGPAVRASLPTLHASDWKW